MKKIAKKKPVAKKATKRGSSSPRKKGTVTKAPKRAVARKSVEGLPRKKPPVSVQTFPASLSLYVYGITQVPERPFSVTSEAVDGRGAVEPFAEGEYLCWASRVSRQEFALDLQKNMENLEWLAACSIRHQKVLAEIGEVTQVLPARFGTVFLSPESMMADLRAKVPNLREIFRRISDADEWGIKVFGVAQPQATAAITASSGADYLRQKSVALQGSPAARRDEALVQFGEELAKFAEASVPGGKASSGQPGLLWSGSFLVKRSQKRRFDEVLKRFAGEWAPARRIDVSGPWPPYSFVSENQ